MTPPLPFELFIKIVEFLPDDVIFKLYQTGRELHGIRSIYIEKILPHIKKTSLLKLENYQKSFYIEIDDGGILKEYGITECDMEIINGVVILKLDFIFFYIPTYPVYLNVLKSKSIIVSSLLIPYDGNLYKTGYILEKIEFTTRYYFFSLLKLKLSKKFKIL